MKTIWHRLSAPTPRFWRRVRAITGGLAAGVAAAAHYDLAPAEWLPLLGKLATVAASIAATASFTGSDAPTDQNPS